LSSVVADAVSHEMIGNALSFAVSPYSLVSSQELIYYAVLGVISAFLGVAFMKTLYWFEDTFDTIHVIPEWIKPAIGGLILGCIGVYFPQIFGVGYESMALALTGKLGMGLLALLALLKIFATSLTLGSGSSGGVFAPSLFIGAMAGTAFGLGIQTLLPVGSIGPAGGYGLVGMAAVFAAASNAPITAILIVFEMTLDYSIMLPLMLGVVLSTAIARGLSAETIYTMKLLRRGIRLDELGDPDVRSRIRIKNIMTRDYPVVRAETPVHDLLGMFAREKTHGFPVVDEDGALCGMVTITDVERALIEGDTRDVSVADIASKTLIVAYHNELLADFFERPGSAEVGYIPVVLPDDPKKLTGVLRRHDILKAYTSSKDHFSLGFERREQNTKSRQ
jgi:CIC family chloride channel protein